MKRRILHICSKNKIYTFTYLHEYVKRTRKSETYNNRLSPSLKNFMFRKVRAGASIVLYCYVLHDSFYTDPTTLSL